jgi:NAD(P)-dependent dehydrogenase (short-subunit alcohol dehydrogenase family)
MNANKILIIGSGSDLLQPLIQQCPTHQLELLGLGRADWDLKDLQPKPELLDSICAFKPSHLIFTAGQNVLTDIHDDPDEIMEEIQNHMVVNCFSFVSLVLLLMNRLPTPLNSVHVLSSLYGIYGRRGRIPYSLSKHALEGAIKCLAIEFPQTQVIGYRPGFFDTKLSRQNIPDSAWPILEARVPLHRFGQPEELSSIILANIQNPVPYLTGICLTIDGAMTAGGIFDQ